MNANILVIIASAIVIMLAAGLIVIGYNHAQTFTVLMMIQMAIIVANVWIIIANIILIRRRQRQKSNGS